MIVRAPSQMERRHLFRKWIPASVLRGVLVLVGGYALASAAMVLSSSMVQPDGLVPLSSEEFWYAGALGLLLSALGLSTVQVLRRDPRDRAGWFLLFFFLRVVLGVLLAFTFQYDDERAFHSASLERVSDMLTGTGGRGYSQLVEMLYEFLFPGILLPKVVNAFIGAMLPFLIYDVTLAVHRDRTAARRAFLFAGLLPPLLIYSAVNLKEAPTAFLLVLEVWFVARPGKRLAWGISGSLCAVGLLFWLRGIPWATVGAIGTLVCLAMPGEGERQNWALPRVLGGLILALALVALVWTAWFGDLLRMIESRLTQETYFIERFGSSEAKVTQFLDVSEPISAKNLSILFLRGLFSPSPARFVLDRGIDTLLELLVMLTWYALVPFAAIGWGRAANRALAHMCGSLGVTVLAFATTAVMLGSDPYRHRIPMMGLFYILAAGGLCWSSERKWVWVVRLWWVGAVAFTGMWLVLRA